MPKIAVYTASIIISSLPFTLDVAEAEDKPQKQNVSLISPKQTPKLDSRNKVFEEKSQQIATEAADVLTGTNQAISMLLKNDAKKQ